MRFIFVRHGESVYNTEGRMQGHLDVELSQAGIRQAQRAAEALADADIAAVYASDLRRAYVTAEIIAAKHMLPVIRDPLIREVYLGKWQGLSIEEIAERYPREHEAYKRDSISNRPPDAERLESLIDRVRRFIEKVAVEGPRGDVVVGGHGGVIRGALCCALEAGPELYRRVRLDNAGVTIVEVNPPGGASVLNVNDVCHLQTCDDPLSIEGAEV